MSCSASSAALRAMSWERLVGLYGDQETAQRQFAQRVAAEIDARGVLDVLRQGVRDRGVQIDLAYFRLGIPWRPMRWPSTGQRADRCTATALQRA